jgi:hypothetical protein
VVRARIDCANPQEIPRRLDNYYDGEGFAVYFDVEAPDGSIVPAEDFDMEGTEDGDKGNHEDQEHKPKEDPPVPPPAKNGSPDYKHDDMQQDPKEKPLESVAHMHLGLFLFPMDPPANMAVDIGDRGIAYVPPKKWSRMVEEDEEEGARSAPPKAGLTKQGVRDTELLSRQSSQEAKKVQQVSVPRHKAPSTPTSVLALLPSPLSPRRFSAGAGKDC